MIKQLKEEYKKKKRIIEQEYDVYDSEAATSKIAEIQKDLNTEENRSEFLCIYPGYDILFKNWTETGIYKDWLWNKKATSDLKEAYRGYEEERASKIGLENKLEELKLEIFSNSEYAKGMNQEYIESLQNELKTYVLQYLEKRFRRNRKESDLDLEWVFGNILTNPENTLSRMQFDEEDWYSKQLKKVYTKIFPKSEFKYVVQQDLIPDNLTMKVKEITEDEIKESLSRNAYVKREFNQYLTDFQELKKLHTIPENVALLYPRARQIKRHFIIHQGPTNSGKTHEGMEALKMSNRGTYLAPLRLLAFEVRENLQKHGIASSLLTGEEEDLVPDAKVICSTCEMADLNTRFEVAVIDEAQMIADKDRGGAWTNAILGICADTIHVCCSPDAVNIVVKLIEDCLDTYEIKSHTRMTPLKPNPQKGFEKGDALVVFGRKKVHSLAGWLQRTYGMRVSIIYGALPYAVRQNEAEKFRTGQTDILVTTDAIGMGMNLPIRRVVFMETSKYDGECVRPLTENEVRQIAGRAGRYGVYDTGYFMSNDSISTAKMNQFMSKSNPDIQEAVLGIPNMLYKLKGTVSKMLEYWQGMQMPGYAKQDISQQIERALFMEKLTDEKEMIWKFITMTFDNKDMQRYMIWQEMAESYVLFNSILPKPTLWGDQADLEEYEDDFKTLDLYYQYFKMLNQNDKVKEVMKAKNDISYKMMKLINGKKFEVKRCSCCGKVLPWNWPYGMCAECHDEMYGNWDNFYDF